jgi:hypothetical protein
VVIGMAVRECQGPDVLEVVAQNVEVVGGCVTSQPGVVQQRVALAISLKTTTAWSSQIQVSASQPPSAVRGCCNW